MKILIIAFALMLSGCAITDPIGAKLSPGSVIESDLTATALNLDQAVAVGALPADDPAPACLHDLLSRTGVGQETFRPQIAGLISAQSILYIKAQQIKNRGELSTACKAIIGDILVGRLMP